MIIFIGMHSLQVHVHTNIIRQISNNLKTKDVFRDSTKELFYIFDNLQFTHSLKLSHT